MNRRPASPRSGSPHWGLELFLVCFAVVDAVSVLVSDLPHRTLVAIGVALSLLVLCARRRAPLAASMVAFALTGIGFWFSPQSTSIQFLGMIVICWVVGAINRVRGLVPAALAGLVLLAYGTFFSEDGGGWPDFLLSSAICLGVMMAGFLLTGRGRQIRHLHAEAALTEERERLRTLTALADERARIARELHDVVSHGLSVVVVQTQAARGALADAGVAGPDAGRHLDAVESTAREALAEMRHMLGLLQLDGHDSDEGPEPPSQGLDDLDALLERTRQAGVPIEAELPEDGTRLSRGLELAVYRIVQEALTNVVKHAPEASTSVGVRVQGGAVDVEVTSAGRSRAGSRPTGANSGHGLVGMRERVLLYGGQLTTAPSADGGFRVHAVIPVDPAYRTEPTR